MTLRAQAERAAEELARRDAYLAAHGGDGGSYCDDPACPPCLARLPASMWDPVKATFSLGLDTDPQREALQLPAWKRLGIRVSALLTRGR